MTVSCPRDGAIWGSATMSTELEALRQLGVDWVSIHPYATIEKDGRVRSWVPPGTPYMEKAAQRIEDSGLKFFLKPHLAYWGRYAWRGDIRFHQEEHWERFFSQYETFIVEQARYAETHGIPLLAIGTELEGTTHRLEDWKRIIASVRKVYGGQLTYAANWDSLDRIGFWGALDFIGIQAYFPLEVTVDGGWEAVSKAWDPHIMRLEALHRQHGRQILLTEIGYNRSLEAARTPWAKAMDSSPEAIALRKNLLHGSLDRLEQVPFIRGLFWWKWIPNEGRYHRDFSMKDPEALSVLEARWGPYSPKSSLAPN